MRDVGGAGEPRIVGFRLWNLTLQGLGLGSRVRV